MDILFSHGRTAFKYGLIFLGLKKSDKIMLPEYICDVLLEPLKKLGIKPIFYKINNDFTVNYTSLKKNYNKSVKALVIINYFGFEECKRKYHLFCKERNIFLIEDNSHFIKSRLIYKNNYSHYEFYSNKKIIKEIFSGASLNINKKRFKNLNKFKSNLQLQKFKISLKMIFNKFLEIKFLIFKRYIKFKFLKMPNYTKLNEINNNKIKKDYKIDDYSKNILKNINLDKIKKERQKNYEKWKIICGNNKLFQVINRQKPMENIPWLFPVFVNNPIFRKKIFDYGWKNGYSIISWPSLPKNNINHCTKNIWNKLICFETDRAPTSLELNIE